MRYFIKILKEKNDPKDKNSDHYKLFSKSNVISFLAVIISILTFAINYYRQNAEDIRSKKEEFRKILFTLIDLRGNFDKGMYNNEQDKWHYFQKMNILISSGELIIAKINNEISPQEYRTFAYHSLMQGDPQKALKYYDIAFQKSENILDRIDSCQELAKYYAGSYVPDLFNENRAREYYEKSIGYLQEPENSYMLYRKLILLYDKLIFELKCNNINSVKNGLNEVEAIIKKLPNQILYAEDVKRYLEDIKRIKKSISEPDSPKN